MKVEKDCVFCDENIEGISFCDIGVEVLGGYDKLCQNNPRCMFRELDSANRKIFKTNIVIDDLKNRSKQLQKANEVITNKKSLIKKANRVRIRELQSVIDKLTK